MVEPLPITWYSESPIDLEYKQYILFAYLQKVENSFINKILSPHLLHMEKMLEEMSTFERVISDYRGQFDKHRYIYLFKDNKLTGENDEMLEEVRRIIYFSVPQLKTRIDFGYNVLEKNKQILY